MENIKSFAILENSELWPRHVILHLKSGIIGYPKFIEHEKQDEVNIALENIVQGRELGVKIPGYSIFILFSGTIMGQRPSSETKISILKEMADFFISYKIEPKPNRYVKYSDNYYRGCPGDWKPLTPEQLAAKKARKAEKMAKENRND